jgi:hypothetical protein
VTDWIQSLRVHADLAAGRALAEHDANPYSPTVGCFDRRYWAWKLVDFPEATFQRLVFPLAMLYRDPSSRFHQQPEVLSAIRSGMSYAGRIQHPNGSFDQAFPFEQSYGATAFLLFPLLEAARLVDEHLDADERIRVHHTCRRAAEFLCANAERHGVIANHLAGAALALAVAADTFKEDSFDAAAAEIVDFLVHAQSPEGWFPEYDGADPGYQTLCIDYLSAYAARRPSAALDTALQRAVTFLQWFVHPDGTFGGVYGSRRTAVVYLAGLARLAPALPVAGAMFEVLATTMSRADSVGPSAVDVGNLAPLLTSTVSALGLAQGGLGAAAPLPMATSGARADFPRAGLFVRSTPEHYAVIGVANGGTVTVFSRTTRRLLLDDGGYVAECADGKRITTQATRADRAATIDGAAIEVEVPFVRMTAALPTPVRFGVLRVMNLTLMRSIAIGNWVKRRLVGLLMADHGEVPLRMKRRIVVDQGVRIIDRIENPTALALSWMTGGRPFSSIHMASAGYSQGGRLGTERPASIVDVEKLARDRAVEVTTQL